MRYGDIRNGILIPLAPESLVTNSRLAKDDICINYIFLGASEDTVSVDLPVFR